MYTLLMRTKILSSGILTTMLLILLSFPMWACAGDIVESPPNSSTDIFTPCSNVASVSNIVHFEGNRWIQVCTDGSQLDGYVLDYGIGINSQLFTVTAEAGLFFQAPRVAVMAAGGIVVLWNQTTDLYQINADTPIYIANFDYTGQQIAPARILQEGAN